MDIKGLIDRPIIRSNYCHEFMNKMTDDEIKLFEKEVSDKLLSLDFTPHTLDWEHRYLTELIDTDILYQLFQQVHQTPPDQVFADYYKMLAEEEKKQTEKSQAILDIVKTMVSEEYYNAVVEFIKDEENGIWGDLKFVDKPIGQWQDEYDPEYDDETYYWSILKGMYVNQSCGYSGDDYNGTLEIKINETLFLRCSFSL